MRVELVTTPSGRETVEINFGGRIEVLSHEEALKLAGWLIDLCQPTKRAPDLAKAHDEKCRCVLCRMTDVVNHPAPPSG